MKICFKCNISKTLDEYYGHPRMKDKHLNKCKECTKIDTRARFRDATKREAIKRTQREWEKTDNGRAYHKASVREYNKRYPEKIKARSLARTLERKPCEVCGVSKVEAHHSDYSKPLNVKWFCPTHHRDWHTKHQGLFKTKAVF